ncbi:Methyltransferase-like protein [Aphelenchoides avenae]|nr:Methyltransferase-like protein [Aphelenchus avenae]
MTHRHPIIPSGAARTSDASDQFGQRYLRDEDAVFEFNAWDDVEWPEEKEQEALETIERQKAKPVPDEEVPMLIHEADAKWEEFYSTHTNRFFMDRKWIAREFPELLEGTSGDGPIRALDVGCGVGNTTFPLLQSNPRLYMHSCDFSATAIDILRGNELFDAQRCDPFVWDITIETDHIEPGSLDYVLCIYVLSAIPPEKQQTAVRNLVRLLKPGGMLLVKDYGRHDLTQLRFKVAFFA